MSEQSNYDAVKALLEAAQAVPMSLGEIKTAEKAGTLPKRYTELYVSEIVLSPVLVGGWSVRSSWRVQTRAVGDTEANARAIRNKAAGALHQQRITVDGLSAVIGRAVSDDPIGEDNGRYTGLSEYTYTL